MAAVSIFNDSAPAAHYPLRAVRYCGSCSGKGRNSCIVKSGCFWYNNKCSGTAQCDDDNNYYGDISSTPECYSAKCSGPPTKDPCGLAFENSTDKSFSDCLKAVPEGMPGTTCMYDTYWPDFGLENSTNICTVSPNACHYLVSTETACVDLGCEWTPAYCDETSDAATISKASVGGPLFLSAISIFFIASYN